MIAINIILNERHTVEQILSEKKIVQNIAYTASVLAKYYLHDKLLTKGQTYQKINEFFTENVEEYNEAKWYDSLDHIIHKARKYELVDISALQIYAEELEILTSYSPRQQRILFSSLCYAKYYNSLNPHNNNWVNSPYKQIFTSANVRIKTDDQYKIIGELVRSDALSLSKKVDNLNYSVNILQNTGTPAFQVTCFDNLGYQYMKHLGDKTIKCCKLCGGLFRYTGKGPRQYCDPCRKIKLTERYAKYYRKKRNS